MKAILNLIKNNFNHPQVRMIITAIIVISAVVGGSVNAIQKYFTKTSDKIEILAVNQQKINERIDRSYELFATKDRMLKDFDYTKKDLLELRTDIKSSLLLSTSNAAKIDVIERFLYCPLQSEQQR